MSESCEQVLPYNLKNTLLQKENVDYFLTTYGVTTKLVDLNVYRKAFVHKSYCTRKNENVVNGNEHCPEGCIPLQEESNERLEYLGDSVLNSVVATYLFERYPNENEGFLTKMRTKLVNGNMLAFLSKSVGLDRFVLISQQIEANDGRNNKKILEDTFESFIAAIYMDFNKKKIKGGKDAESEYSGMGFQIAQKWIINVIDEWVDMAELVKANDNYKDLLIKYYQHSFQANPRFVEKNVTTENGKKMFTICVKDDNETVMGIGKSDSKKKAEQVASMNALIYLGQLTQ